MVVVCRVGSVCRPVLSFDGGVVLCAVACGFLGVGCWLFCV